MNISAPTSASDSPPASREMPVAEFIPVFARDSEVLDPDDELLLGFTGVSPQTAYKLRFEAKLYEAPSRYATEPPEVVAHPWKYFPGLVKVFAFKFACPSEDWVVLLKSIAV